MEKVVITKEHCKLMGDFFINSGIDAKKLDYVINDMKSYLGEENAGLSISYALQKSGLNNSLFAGALAKQLADLKQVPFLEYETELEKEEKIKEALKLIENQK